MKRTYLDHAATTPVAPSVLDEMIPFFSDHGYNPSGVYMEARQAGEALEKARELVAETLVSDPEDIVFTGSGSEGVNLALKGAAMAAAQRGRDVVIISAVEHQAVMRSAEYLDRHLGLEVRIIDVDRCGTVDLNQLNDCMDERVGVVSIQYANNEVGTIQPIKEAAEIVHGTDAIFHTDAVQAPGSLQMDVDQLGVDLLSIAAHKFYGPKGVGALYVRRGTRVVPQIQGGSQERNRRAGTENVALVVGLAAALNLVRNEMRIEEQRSMELKLLLQEGLAKIPGVVFNGSTNCCLANNTHICVEGVRAEGMLLKLDKEGISVSSGSACTSASLEPSHVLLAMGISPDLARGSLRITTGRGNTTGQIENFIDVLGAIIDELRVG
tara:strand:+ start:2298 stop:3443 length:1146 start_codon:yes stop_codon:yes gene_type:complete